MEWLCINGWRIWIHVKIVSAHDRILLVLPLFKIWLYKQWYDTWQMWLQRSVWAQQPLTWWMTEEVLGLSEAIASLPLSLVRPKAAHSRVPGLINGYQAGILAAVPSQPFMVLQHCGRLGFCGFWKRFFCPLWWKLLLFCSLSSNQQATFLTSAWGRDTRWRHRICLLVTSAHCWIFSTKQNIVQRNYRIS